MVGVLASGRAFQARRTAAGKAPGRAWELSATAMKKPRMGVMLFT